MIARLPDSSPVGSILRVSAVTVFAFASFAASGRVVYHDIPDVFVYAWSTAVLDVDFDGDGFPEIRFRANGQQFDAYPFEMNRLLGIPATPPDIGGLAFPLEQGESISTRQVDPMRWVERTEVPGVERVAGLAFSACAIAGNEPFCLGLFPGRTGYLGVEFQIDSETHYGWIHIDHTLGISAGWVTGFAYETRPGVPIVAGARPEVEELEAPEAARPGQIRLRWSAEEGAVYQVQRKGSLDAPFWEDLPFTLPATSAEVAVDLPMEGEKGFFRVVVVEE